MDQELDLQKSKDNIGSNQLLVPGLLFLFFVLGGGILGGLCTGLWEHFHIGEGATEASARELDFYL